MNGKRQAEGGTTDPSAFRVPPSALLPAWVRAELLPSPGRWRRALAMTGSASAALLLAMSLQVASFPAPLCGFKALMPNVVSSWRNLPGRLAVIIAAAAVAVTTSGVLVQVPWLLLPVLFVELTVVTYLAPVRQSPIRGYIALLTLTSVVYAAIFTPAAIGATAVEMACAFAIGLTVATATAAIGATVPPRTQLADALADAFTRVRPQLSTAGERFRAGSDPPPGGEPEMPSALPGLLQLLALVRQDVDDRAVERAFVALITAAERAASYGVVADLIARQAVGRTYRRLVDAELAALLDALDRGLARFAVAARNPEAVLSVDPAPHQRAPDWPDFPALLGALRDRQRALSQSGALTAIAVAESVNLNSFVQALEGVADVLHLPPEALEHTAAAGEVGAAPWLPPFDRYAAQFAAKIALAGVLALIVGVASHARALETSIVSALLLAQSSYGATIRQAGLRIAGVLAGGLLALLTVIAVMPNTGDVTLWMAVFSAVMLPCTYLSLGSPRISYLGQQTAITYMIVLVANHPVTDVNVVLWRLYGTLLGVLLLFAVFEVVAPDYAGRQIVSRFGDLLRDLISILPVSGSPLPPVARTGALGDQMVAGVGDILRLAEEARYEGERSGIERTAAVDAAGILRRLAHRWALVRRSRRVAARPPLPAAEQSALLEVERHSRARLERLARMLAARHHRDRVGSHSHRAACEAAAAIAATPVPDLDGSLAIFVGGIERLRAAGGLAAWPLDASRALLAEVGHWQRIATLLPKLEIELVRTILPAAAVAAQPAAIGDPCVTTGSA